MNRCGSCRGLFEGHVQCPHCGQHGYHDLNQFAGMVIRDRKKGATYAAREQIAKAGAKFDSRRKEWVLPLEITSEQFDALTPILQNDDLRLGWYDNPADYDEGPIPEIAYS